MGKFKDIAIQMMEDKAIKDSSDSYTVDFLEETPNLHTPNEIESAAHDVEGIFTTYDEYEIVELLSADVKERVFNALLEYMDD